MLKLALLLFSSFVLYNLCFAAVAILPYQVKPAEYADQEGCFIPDFKIVIPYNKPYFPAPADGYFCSQYTCTPENNETQIFTCGKAAAPDGCKLVPVNTTMPYPHCCDFEVQCGDTTTTEAPTTEGNTESNASSTSTGESAEAKSSTGATTASAETNETGAHSQASTDAATTHADASN